MTGGGWGLIVYTAMATRWRASRGASEWCGVVLAAGKGVRMKSSTPKVLHPVAGIPMLAHVTLALRAASVGKVVVVVPAGAAESPAFLAAAGPEASLVDQLEPKGTADALLTAKDAVNSAANILLTYGDVPLLRAETLDKVMREHLRERPAITMLTAVVPDPRGLGRVVRDRSGAVTAVVEEKDADAGTFAIKEVNSGCYAFDAEWIWSTLPGIRRSNSGEFYLTDAIAFAIDSGRKVHAVTADDPTEVDGVNDRVQLAAVEGAMRERARTEHMLAGVTLIDPSTVYIDAAISIGQDTVIGPNTHLLGSTRIGARCEIGPNSYLRDAIVEDDTRVIASYIEGACIGQRVSIGPYSRIRPGTVIEDEAYVGNFGEIKNSRIGSGTHVGHFSYIGDATLGKRVNIGAGTVTCNFDGTAKHQTIIGDDAFIGSDTMLVAPISVGEGGRTGAGSVATKDVPPGVTVVGVPARPAPSREQPLGAGEKPG
ncbi:MAG: bifunctional UDP-N-acetylglucosamine diphosphorylase/glucosamine-1-phosphate N-acetyltransferase GlmU [Chloroflexi bacterium]|nr:bifunctional UDP-N-acetylglucosamine diphosphorylase/glucosamine-1-phosphate N-acetyltransferase GlmU [Chloroflexota bacterium]